MQLALALRAVSRRRHARVQRERVAEYSFEWPRVSPVRNEDAALVLAYAVVMLSTNVHNPSVRAAEKMSLHQFCRQMEGQNDGESYPADFLAEVFESIRSDKLEVRT